MKKRVYSLALVLIMLFSAISFAEEQRGYERVEFDSDLYEDKSKERDESGVEYEERVIVNYDTEESREMMERMMRGELSEDEMHRMAKVKFGEGFSEEGFESGMKDFKRMMSRKEAFSYEHQGYEQYEQKYYSRPSYEGYSKEHMIFGMVFEDIGEDMDPRDIKQYCNEPEKIADIIINKFREKVGDAQKVCSRIDEQEAKCNENSKKTCSQIGSAFVKEDATEIEKINAVAYSCPVNKDALIEACKARSKFYSEQRINNADEVCRERFDFEGERLIKQCERFKESHICEKDRYIELCLKNFGAKKEDFDEYGKRKPICPKYLVPTCGEGSVLKTKVDAKGCEHYYCEAAQPECPQLSLPLCVQGYNLVKKVDEKGCVIYSCEPSTTQCPTDTRQCPDGSYVKRVSPSCDFEQCPTPRCPEPIIPSCGTGQTLQRKTDSNGCIYYYCEQQACPQLSKPSCATDETLQVYYDNAGCVSSYQCIKHQTCPEVTKPTCAEGQNLVVKYDDKKCVVGYECVSVTTTTTTTSTQITGQAVLKTYDDFVRQCENRWQDQQRICLDTPEICDKESFIEKCKEREKKNYGDYLDKIKEHCERETKSEIKHAEHRCLKIEEERQRCFENSNKRCGQMKDLVEKCRETLTEDNLRKFVIEEAKKRCKFTDIVSDEEDLKKAGKVEIILAVLNTATQADIDKLELFIDELEEELKLQDTTVYKGKIDPSRFGDVKLFPFVVNAKISTVVSAERAKEVKEGIVSGEKVEEAASKLVSLRDSDVPKEYLYIIEDKASDIVDVSDELEEQEKIEESKGLGYKLKRFLGLAQKQELEEIGQLNNNIEKLSNSITVLSKVAEEVPSDVAKAIIKEQIESLKEQKEDISELIETKEKKAKGFLALFG